MAEPEWYRRESWTSDAASTFEGKLQRARSSSRPQYLKIQGATLALGSSDQQDREVGRSLLRRVLSEYPDDFHAKHAAETSGSAYALDGLLKEAEDALRLTIEMCRRSPIGYSATTGVPELLLAEVLIQQGGRAVEAIGLLDAVSDRVTESPIRTFKYRFVLTYARAADQVGDPAAQDLARQAIEVAEMTGPVFARHPTFGVPEATTGELSELRRIAGFGKPHGKKRRFRRE